MMHINYMLSVRILAVVILIIITYILIYTKVATAFFKTMICVGEVLHLSYLGGQHHLSTPKKGMVAPCDCSTSEKRS